MKKQKSVSYYEILKVSPQASDADVKAAYRRLLRIYHPDFNPQNQEMATKKTCQINEAYANLRTKEKRKQYNKRMLGTNDNTIIHVSNSKVFWSSFYN